MSSHNNIPATKGNFYHYYLVIDKLFDLEKNQKIMIEVAGDITKATIDNEQFLENIEVKYHQGENELKYTNVDFWKSIKNWVKDIDKYSSNTKLILHTTSTLHPNLLNFNDKTIDERLELIEEWKLHTDNTEILGYYNFIKSKIETLRRVLNQIIFVSEQIDYSDVKIHIIQKHKDYFDTFEDNEHIKMDALVYFVGLIVDKLIDKNNWEIDFETFRTYRNAFIYNNQPNKKIIEESEILEVNEHEVIENINNNSLYIQKLNDIELGKDELLEAGRNKYRALNFSNKLMNYQSSMYSQKIKDCERIFINYFEGKKGRYQRKVKQKGHIESSQDLYDNLTDIEISCLHEEDKTQSFRKGLWHILADDEEKPNQISWLLKDEKL